MSRDVTGNLRRRIEQLQQQIREKNNKIESLLKDLQLQRNSARIKERIKADIDKVNDEINDLRESIANIERRMQQLVEE